MTSEKILCIGLKRIGDVLMTTPSVRALKETFPDAEIHFLTQKPSDQIFLQNPHVSKVHLYPSQDSPGAFLSLTRQLRREQFTTVIDFYGQPKTAFLVKLTGAPTRIGYHRPRRSIFYSHAVKTKPNGSYSAIQQGHLLSELGISKIKSALEFPVSPDDDAAAEKILTNIGWDPQKPLVSISPVSRQDYKIWPADKFAAVADFLVEAYGAQILFLWGPGEGHFVEAVRSSMRNAALPDYDIPSITETVALLKRVNLHVGNDNGPMHFAIATGVKTVAIFGRPLLRNWTPPKQTRHLAVEYDPGCKEKCHYPKCELECIKQVPLPEVMEKVKRQVAQLASHS